VFTDVDTLLGEHARRRPGKVFIESPDQGARITFGEFEALTRRFANFLASEGVRRGDRISVLSDNAIEALGGVSRRSSETWSPGIITLATTHDPAQHVVRLVVADNGPGISTADRDKLFMPYYSTKKRGSGLGLAIVRRIIVEHGGTIEVGDNRGAGTRFTIELPC